MLPALNPDGMRLADVLESSLSAVRSETNRLSLAPVSRAIVLLADGLGIEALRARSGHARTLMSAVTKRSVIESGFPTTTAAALASLTTGTAPGQHGLVGYSVLDAAHDRVVNQLSGWDARLDPATWQREPTVFERATNSGIGATVVAAEQYRHSGFTRAVLRGARYVAGASIADRVAATIDILAARESEVIYLYVPELDKAAHAYGWESGEWTAHLEELDSALRSLVAALGPGDGLLVTADHGVLDVPEHAHVLFDSAPALIDGVRHVAGDPRCLQLYFEPDASSAVRERTIDAWRTSESDRSWVATRHEAVDAGWFGVVDPEVAPRVGDLLIAARKSVAYYDGRNEKDHGRSMIGQHGSWTSAEVRVPLLRFGAFTN